MTVIQAPSRDPHPAHRDGVAVVLAVTVALLLAAAGVLLARTLHSSGSPVRGSGIAATQTRALPAFGKLDLAGSNNVIVTVGGRRSVVVHADKNLLRDVTTRVASGTLVIGTVGSFTTKAPMSVVVTMPSLTSVDLSGSGTVSISGINAALLTVTLPGSGIVRASGTVRHLNVTLGGSGEALLTPLVADHVRAILAGSGLIQVTATTSLYAAVPGTGEISYAGNPAQLTTRITGTGAVTRS